MIQPQDIYDYKDIIIPVIGNNCFYYESGNEQMSLQEFVVNTLSKGKIYDKELLTQMESRGYYGLTLLKKHCFHNESKFKLEYKRAIENNKGKIHLNATIKNFLQVYKFPVIVTTSCFKLIESELLGYKSVSYPSEDGNRNKLSGEQKTVYHIFGLEANGAKWVTGEEELLNFVHELHRDDGATDLKKFINADNKKKALFVIGCNLPDWLFRFFLYPMADISKNGLGYFLSSSDDIEDSFMNFLDEISYDYDVNANLENVLKCATDLCPASTSTQSNSNRVPHGKEYDIFISYASENRDLASSIRDVLHDTYGLNVWLDQKQIVDGDYEKRIINGIKKSAYFMPLVTKEYIGKHKHIFNEYKSVEDIVNDKKLEFVQMETLIAEKRQEEDRRITYSLPIVIPSTICRGKTLDFGMIENNCTEMRTLPSNLFKRQNMFYYEDAFNGQKDWSIYKTIEL